ncbi:MAG: hypothetical protein LAT84_02515 [Balneolia bacterium]|nr:hypothetical protein [Balneolia bacterium]
MKQSYSQQETIEILKRALTAKDKKEEESDDVLTITELEKMAFELGISKAVLQKAAAELSQTREQNRDETFPEVVATKWIEGRLSDAEIDNFFSELKLEFGGSYLWSGKPSEVHKMGQTCEYQLKDALITLTDKGDGYQLRVIKQQFYHGNSLEAAIVSIPAAFIIGFLPVAAAAEWLHLYIAILTGAVIYGSTFFMVKNHIRKKRSETVQKLLRVSDYAEMRLSELVQPAEIIHDDIAPDLSEDTKTTQAGNRDSEPDRDVA